MSRIGEHHAFLPCQAVRLSKRPSNKTLHCKCLQHCLEVPLLDRILSPGWMKTLEGLFLFSNASTTRGEVIFSFEWDKLEVVLFLLWELGRSNSFELNHCVMIIWLYFVFCFVFVFLTNNIAKPCSWHNCVFWLLDFFFFPIDWLCIQGNRSWLLSVMTGAGRCGQFLGK